MKLSTIYSAIIAVVFASLLTSCAFLQKGEFAQRKYYDFPRTKHSDTQTSSVVTPDKTTAPATVVNEVKHIVTAPLLSASVNKKEFISSKTENDDLSKTSQIKIIKTTSDVEQIESPFISFKKSDIKKQAIKNTDHLPSSDPDVMLILLIILAIFIPPLAVYLKNNEANKWFWITLVLWLLGGGIAFGGVGYGGLLWAAAVIIAVLYVLDML